MVIERVECAFGMKAASMRRDGNERSIYSVRSIWKTEGEEVWKEQNHGLFEDCDEREATGPSCKRRGCFTLYSCDRARGDSLTAKSAFEIHRRYPS